VNGVVSVRSVVIRVVIGVVFVLGIASLCGPGVMINGVGIGVGVLGGVACTIRRERTISYPRTTRKEREKKIVIRECLMRDGIRLWLLHTRPAVFRLLVPKY